MNNSLPKRFKVLRVMSCYKISVKNKNKVQIASIYYTLKALFQLFQNNLLVMNKSSLFKEVSFILLSCCRRCLL